MEITSYTRLTLCPRQTGKELIRRGTSYAGHTMWRRNKGLYKEKSRARRTASFALSAQHYLLSTYPETTAFPHYWRSGSPNDLCSPTKSNLLPPSLSYFKNPVIIFILIFLKLPAYSLVALERYISNFNSFYYCSPQLSPSSYMPLAFQSNIFGLWSLCYGALWCSATWHSAQYSNSYCS